MKIWIIGVRGVVGSCLLKYCQNSGIDVIGTTREEVDVLDSKKMLEACQSIKPNAIVNCAAFTDVDGAEKHVEEAFRVNVEGAKNIASVAKKLQVRLVHLSTDYVFNGMSKSPYKEEDECDPINMYGKSKREGEIKVLEELASACILRTSWVFGQKGKNFVSSVLNLLQQKEELKVIEDQWGRPTYCWDLAKAIITLIHAEGIVHFANEGLVSRFQIAQDVLKAAKQLGLHLKCERILPVPSSYFPTVAKRPGFSVLDTKKYTKITNHKPRSWDEVINEFLSYALASS